MDYSQRSKYLPPLSGDLPEFSVRVDSPWADRPDIREFNRSAFNTIGRELQRIRASKDPQRPSRGVLVLGEAGSGKTHLLMRVARKHGQKNHVLFVGRPNDEDGVAQHVWSHMLDSLLREPGTNEQASNHLENLLCNVFSNVLKEELGNDVQRRLDVDRKERWIARLEQNPMNLTELPGGGENRQRDIEQLRRSTLRFIQNHHPQVDQTIAKALISYCLVSDRNRRKTLVNWLRGYEIEEREAVNVGLPEVSTAINDSTDASYQQRRETFALRAIQAIGVLSTYHEPLILAFDELEGLRDKRPLTRNWGDTLREVFTRTPNMLVVTCVFPSTWNEWFCLQLDNSAVDRIAQTKTRLDDFQVRHGEPFLKLLMEKSFENYSLPTRIYPFCKEDIAELCSRSASPSPRAFIQAVSSSFNQWLDDSQITEEPTLLGVLEAEFNQLRDEQLGSANRVSPADGDFISRIKLVLEYLVPDFVIDVVDRNGGALPAHIIVQSQDNRTCIAIANEIGNKRGSQIKNLVSAKKLGQEFDNAILLRDANAKQLAGKAFEYLRSFQRMRGGNFMEYQAEECKILNALYGLFKAAEQRDLSFGTQPIGTGHVRDYIKASGCGRSSQLLNLLTRWIYPLDNALGSTPAKGNSATVPSQIQSPSPQPETAVLEQIREIFESIYPNNRHMPVESAVQQDVWSEFGVTR